MVWPVLGLDADDRAAAAVDVAQQVALIFVGRGDFDLHDRFEQDRAGLLDRVLERENAGHLERQFVRVHFVERAVHDLRP